MLIFTVVSLLFVLLLINVVLFMEQVFGMVMNVVSVPVTAGSFNFYMIKKPSGQLFFIP